MKNTIAAIALSLSAFAWATPSSDNYAAVTNDWYQGNWTNVYELAQKRLAANTNDLVASHLMVSYDILFDFLPQQTAATLQEQRAKSQISHKPLDCDFILEQISESGLWTPLLQ